MSLAAVLKDTRKSHTLKKHADDLRILEVLVVP